MHVVIVGCGVAGITAAITVRENNPEAKVSICTDENHFYYPRPRLYEVLSGEVNPEDIYAFPEQWYEKRGIKVYLNKKAMNIASGNKEIRLENNTIINYDKLLLANGACPFIPPVKGVEKAGVFTLRSITDALTIKEYAKKTRKTIIVGGGLLGLEFAASLRKLGQEVEVVEISPHLLPLQLDHDGAAILKNRIEVLGITIQLGVKTTEILGKETFSGIALDNGKELPGDLVLFSAGIRSNVNLAANAGIKVNKGVIVDQYLQTSVNDVYVAGDVAEFEGKVYGIIPAAEEQARVAALNILEKGKRVYRGTIPSNTLKIVGMDLTSMGIINTESSKYEEIKKINRETGIYKKIVLDQGKIVGAIILGDKRMTSAIRRLMDLGTDVSQYKAYLLEEDYSKLAPLLLNTK